MVFVMAEPNSPPPSKRKLTYNLSTLMILVTVSAILLFLLRGMVFNPGKNKVFFFLGSVAIPICAILAVNLTLKIRRFLARRRELRARQTVESEP